jgi:hypothetical protein
MPKIKIGTNIVNFPNSGSDALWSPAVIQFAELVESELEKFTTGFDISPTVFNITILTGSTYDIGADFNPVNVRKFILDYAIYRESDSTSIVESGVLTGIYNDKLAEWKLQDEFNGDKTPSGTAYHSFSIITNRVQLTTKTIPGSALVKNNTISFSAKTELIQIGI